MALDIYRKVFEGTYFYSGSKAPIVGLDFELVVRNLPRISEADPCAKSPALTSGEAPVGMNLVPSVVENFGALVKEDKSKPEVDFQSLSDPRVVSHLKVV